MPSKSKHFFDFICHPPVGFNYIARRNIYIAIVNGSKNSKRIDSCFYVKMLIWWRGNSRGPDCSGTISCSWTNSSTKVKRFSNDGYIRSNAFFLRDFLSKAASETLEYPQKLAHRYLCKNYHKIPYPYLVHSCKWYIF